MGGYLTIEYRVICYSRLYVNLHTLKSSGYKLGKTMSTKEWVSSHSDGASIYQECFYDSEKHDINPNPAVVQVDGPCNYSVTREEYADGRPCSQLVVEVPADRFDEIAIAWCKKRKLHGALGGPDSEY